MNWACTIIFRDKNGEAEQNEQQISILIRKQQQLSQGTMRQSFPMSCSREMQVGSQIDLILPISQMIEINQFITLVINKSVQKHHLFNWRVGLLFRLPSLIFTNLQPLPQKQFVNPIFHMILAIKVKILLTSASHLMPNLLTLTKATNCPMHSTPWEILGANITRISNKFTTSEWFYHMESINECLTQKRNSSTAILQQCAFDREGELMEKCYDGSAKQEMSQLIAQYQYYSQGPIIFDKAFYQVVRLHQENKKLLQYNQLKRILNFEQETVETSVPANTKNGPNGLPHFNLLSNITFTRIDQESFLIQKLKNKLEKEFGPNRHSTIEDLDKKYRFEKKVTQPAFSSIKKQAFEKKYKMGSHIGKGDGVKKKRNNSCQSLITNRKELKHKKQSLKGHHKSITYLYSPPACLNKKVSPFGKLQSRSPIKCVDREVKWKIMSIKSEIKKEKRMVKKKITALMNIPASTTCKNTNHIKRA